MKALSALDVTGDVDVAGDLREGGSDVVTTTDTVPVVVYDDTTTPDPAADGAAVGTLYVGYDVEG